MPTQVQPPPAKASEHTQLVTVPVGQKLKAFLDVREMAALLGLSTAMVRAEIRTGRMPAIHRGRRVIIPASWVARLQAEADRLVRA